MLTLPVENIIVEGIDLSGKSTAHKMIHSLSQYRWNVIDRSTISRLLYSKFYGRNNSYDQYYLTNEISNLNNRFLIMNPDFSVISKRYLSRGDELQDVDSLKNLYTIFNDIVSEISSHPNVSILESENSDDDIRQFVSSLTNSENTSIELMTEMIIKYVSSSNNESFPVRLTFYDDGSFSTINTSCLEVKSESEYYRLIMGSIGRKINEELENGQTLTSRRFIHTNQECLSLFHFMFRDNVLDVFTHVRSSNVKDNLLNDMRFIHVIGRYARNALGIRDCPVRFRINFGSAHILD